MATTTISLEVDADAARTFTAASEEHRRKLQLLLRLRLRELTARTLRPLKEVMDDAGRYAEAQGLTAEILESLLTPGCRAPIDPPVSGTGPALPPRS